MTSYNRKVTGAVQDENKTTDKMTQQHLQGHVTLVLAEPRRPKKKAGNQMGSTKAVKGKLVATL